MRPARYALLLLAVLLAGILAADGFSCTNIIIGREATVDGSVITSHTGCAPDCRVHVVPAMTHEKGSEAPVFFGILDATVPFKTYGEVIGRIPQAEQTYRYFHSAYSHMNEHQPAIAESTMSQRPELEVEGKEGEALALYRESPEKARQFLTGLAAERMERVMEMYRRTLRGVLSTRYTNNHEWL
jgi:dipeptidase